VRRVAVRACLAGDELEAAVLAVPTHRPLFTPFGEYSTSYAQLCE